MTGLADDLRATRAHVRRGMVSQTYADAMVDRGERWLAGLGARASSRGFAEEADDVREALAELREAVAEGFPKRICLLRVPARLSKTQATMRQDEALANLGALQHADPGPLLKAGRAQLPSVAVYRFDQGWVQRTRRKRARVEVAYELVVGGRHVLIGSKRYVMRHADWALKCDVFGRLPEIETLTGLAKRRALHKARVARRKEAATKERKRERFKRRVPNWMRRIASAMVDSIWRSVMRPSYSWLPSPGGNSPGTMSMEASSSADGSGPWHPRKK